jgi:hypothetical protein
VARQLGQDVACISKVPLQEYLKRIDVPDGRRESVLLHLIPIKINLLIQLVVSDKVLKK